MNVGNLQITVKLNDGSMPKILKALVLPVRVWAWFERMKCKLLRRTPYQVNVNLSVDCSEPREPEIEMIGL